MPEEEDACEMATSQEAEGEFSLRSLLARILMYPIAVIGNTLSAITLIGASAIPAYLAVKFTELGAPTGEFYLLLGVLGMAVYLGQMSMKMAYENFKWTAYGDDSNNRAVVENDRDEDTDVELSHFEVARFIVTYTTLVGFISMFVGSTLLASNSPSTAVFAALLLAPVDLEIAQRYELSPLWVLAVLPWVIRQQASMKQAVTFEDFTDLYPLKRRGGGSVN